MSVTATEYYTQERIHEIVEKQRQFFRSGKTMDVDWRIRQLKRLKAALLEHEREILDALHEDLGRADTEAYFCDIGSVILEINETIHGVKKWAKPEKHFSGLTCFPSLITRVYPVPYGVSLIISPFNFPFLLSLGVLAAAIAGGNTAVIKASSKSEASTAITKRIISDIFPEYFVTVIDGGHDVADRCLEERYDKIFYTGSPKVAKHVLSKAAVHLTSTALELGGENGNWAIVRKDAKLKDAARKIAFFKACNSGQVCINVNQVAVAEEVADAFVEELKKAFTKQLGKDPVHSEEYARLINRAAYDKCAAEAEEYRDRIVFGGVGDEEALKYAPTIIYPVGKEEPVVNHELFCPLLPVVPFKDDEVDALLATIEEREHPLALYLFTKDMSWARQTMATMQYGGGCINEVCLHMMVKGAPFNGTGHSGMGAYHGKWGFKEFTHPSGVLEGMTIFNLPLREHPYLGVRNAWKKVLVKLFER